jgi:hypothetical protein
VQITKNASFCLREHLHLSQIYRLAHSCGECDPSLSASIPNTSPQDTRDPGRFRTDEDVADFDRPPKVHIVISPCSMQTLIPSSSAEPAPLQQSQLQPLLDYLSVCVQATSHNKRDVAVQCLEAILPRHEVRQAVWVMPGILSGFEKTSRSVVTWVI